MKKLNLKETDKSYIKLLTQGNFSRLGYIIKDVEIKKDNEGNVIITLKGEEI